MPEEKIIINMIKCNTCKVVLLSLHRHDFRQCSCGVAVDGGQDYLKRQFKNSPDDYEELSIVLLPNGTLRKVVDNNEKDQSFSP